MTYGAEFLTFSTIPVSLHLVCHSCGKIGPALIQEFKTTSDLCTSENIPQLTACPYNIYGGGGGLTRFFPLNAAAAFAILPQLAAKRLFPNTHERKVTVIADHLCSIIIVYTV